MSIPTIIIIVALVLAIIDEVRAQGQSLVAWAVILLSVALLWGKF